MGSVTIRTKQITREKLAKLIPDNHELVRLLESMAFDITVNIPDALDPTVITSDEGADLAQTAQALAVAAQAIAREALALGRQANEGPPLAPVVLQAGLDEGPPPAPRAPAPDDQPPLAPVVLPDIPDDVTAMVYALHARLAVTERAIAELREGPTP